MAALNFPNSPSLNDTHTENGVTFKWNGAAWDRLGDIGAQGSAGAQGAVGAAGAQGSTGPVAGSSSQVVYKDGSNNPAGSANFTFDGTNLTVGGNVSIGGTLTYEDVTNIDSVGIVTARIGVKASNIQIGVTGGTEIDTTSGNLTLDSAGGTTTVDDYLTVTGGGNVSAGDWTFTGANSKNVTWDNSEGNLEWVDNAKATFGTGNDLLIYHDGSHSYVLDNGTGDLRLASNSITRITKGDSETCAAFNVDGASELYYDNSKKFETTSYGSNVTGDLRITDNSARLQLYDANASSNTQCTGGFEVYDQNGNRGAWVGLTESASSIHFGIHGSDVARISSNGTLNLDYGAINLGTADSSSGHINAYELMTFNIDSDNDDSNRHFTWYKNGASGGGTGMMRLDENGRLCVGGDLATSGNNLTLKHASDVEIDMHSTSGSGNNFRIKSDSAGKFTIRDQSAGSDRLTILDNGDIGIGEDGPTARLHVRSTGITAGAPSEGWPDWNADNDNNAKIVALLETAGNGDNGTSGHGASVVLRMGQYYDSRAVISPAPGGGASPSDQGVGHGKDLMVKGGRSDNTNGRNGGRLFLDGGGGFNSGSFGNLIGDVILQSQGGYIGLNGQTNPEYPFDLIDGNNRAYFTQGSDSTMSLVLYDNSNHRVSIQGYGGQLRLNTTPTSGGSLESCMRFSTDGDAIIGSGFNEDPTANRRLTVKDTNSIFRIESPGSASTEYTQIEFKTGSTSAWIWKNPTSNSNYGGADSLNIYHTQNADIAFLTNGNNVRFKVRGDGNLQVGPNGNNFVKNEYKGSVSVTGTNNESFAFEIQGSSYASGGLLFVYGTSGNVVVNASAEILVNHSQDVTIKSMSGAYTQLRIRVKTDNNARAAIHLGRNAGYGQGTTSLNWKFIPYGGTYLYTTESTNNGTDHTHVTQSGSFYLTAVGGGSANVAASGSKTFLINHPLESLRETTRLAHAAVEGPECNTIYRGKVDLVDGTATVNIDTNSRMTEGTFVALNQNVQCFTTNETGWTAIKGSVSGNLLTITAQDNTCTDTISWMVVGERHDQDIINNRATDSEGRFIPEITDEYDPSQFPTYPEES